ncbi:MAG: paraquat-inducible protein A [Pseudomonadales bacterium]|nr:paraquat-inducible protein A [Pseudomonadales bacterium]
MNTDVNANTNARDQQLAVCHLCHKLNHHTDHDIPKDYKSICSRCGQEVDYLKKYSLQKTWAYLIAGFILLIPANLFPITSVTELGDKDADTIYSGIVRLIDHQFYFIATLIFIASIIVPVFKITSMIYLLMAVHFQWLKGKRQRLFLFRFVEFIGRWSMLDIFVMAVLLAMVNMGNIALVEAEIGVTFFAAVVILTMLAAESFDSRLIWQDEKSAEVTGK